MTRADDIAPRVAVKSHLDGDPNPRPGEILEWDLMRRTHGLEQMLALILLPDVGATSKFAGYAEHWWAIRERNGKVVCEPTEVQIEVVP